MQVGVKVGGDFVLRQHSLHGRSLFVAGGIGITALSAMIGDIVEYNAASAATPTYRTTLLYSGDAILRKIHLLPLLVCASLSLAKDLMLHIIPLVIVTSKVSLCAGCCVPLKTMTLQVGITCSFLCCGLQRVALRNLLCCQGC